MKTLIFVLLAMAYCTNLMAACEVVEGGKKTPFDGKSIAGLSIEKKSISTLNKAFPDLNIIEKSFKGEAQTCTSCSDKYITCSN
jgi:hypothetical protein